MTRRGTAIQTRVTYSLLLLDPPTPKSTLFPYTTLFRSQAHRRQAAASSRARLVAASTAAMRASRKWCASSAPSPASVVPPRSEEHTSELQSRLHLVCRLLLEKKKG